MGSATRLVQLLKRRLHLIEVPLTRICQSNARIAPLKQRDAELFLKTPNPAADTGLPDSQHLCRASQASTLSGGYKKPNFG